MPRLKKRIKLVVTLPESWEWDPTDADGKKLLSKPAKYELGPGEISIWSLLEKDFAELQDDSVRILFSESGERAIQPSNKKSREELFLRRVGGVSDDGKIGEMGSWSQFYGNDGQALNCIPKNIREFAHFEGLRHFVCSHVGPILDKESEGKATDEEKNLLKSLTGRQEEANEHTNPGTAKRAVGRGPKE